MKSSVLGNPLGVFWHKKHFSLSILKWTWIWPLLELSVFLRHLRWEIKIEFSAELLSRMNLSLHKSFSALQNFIEHSKKNLRKMKIRNTLNFYRDSPQYIEKVSNNNSLQKLCKWWSRNFSQLSIVLIFTWQIPLNGLTTFVFPKKGKIRFLLSTTVK